jgi:TP901 family phage tail tape measure protein
MSFGGASLGSASGVVLIDVTQALASLGELNAALAASSGAGAGAFGGATKSATSATGAMTQMGAALGLVFAGSIKTAADFEFRMSAIQSVLGITDQQAQGLRQTILEVGQASIFTNGAVADTAQELALLGVSAENISKGALKAVVDLSAATETAPQVAANVIASVMNQYGLAGDQVQEVADVFTRASNQSSADVQSIGEGFAYAGSVANALGISYQDLIAYLEILNDRNIKGTTAGTSLAQALTSVVNPTNEASDKMLELGINVKDAAGNFIGVPALLEQLHTALDGLGDVDRDQILDTIFGTRGGKAIRELLNSTTEDAYATGKGMDDYTRGLNEGSTATEQAAQRMDNLRGSIEKLKGSISTLAVQLGTPLLGGLKTLVDGLTALAQAMGQLPPVFAQAAAAIGAPLALFGSFRFVSVLANKSIFRMIPGFEGLAKVMFRLSGPLAVALALFEGISLIHKFNILGLGDQMDSLASKVKTAVSIIKPAWDLLKSLFSTPFADDQKFTTQTKALNAFTVAAQKLGLSFEDTRTVRTFFTQMALPLRRARNLFRDATQGASDMFKTLTGKGNQHVLDDLRARMERLFGPELGRQVFQGARNLRASIKRFTDQLSEAVGFDIDPFGRLKEGIKNLPKDLNRGITWFEKHALPVIGKGLNFALRTGAKALDRMGTAFTRPIRAARKMVEAIADLNPRKFMAGLGDLLASPAKFVGQALKSINTGFKPLDNLLHSLGAVATDFGRIIQEVFQGDFAGALAVGERLLGHLGDVATRAWDLIKTGFDAIPWSDIWNGLVDIGSGIYDAIASTITDTDWSALAGLVSSKIKEAIGLPDEMSWTDYAKLLLGTLKDDVVAEISSIDFSGIGTAIWNKVAETATTFFQAAFPVVVRIAATIGGILWNGITSLGAAIAQAGGFLVGALPEALHVAVNIAATIGGILWNGAVGIGQAIAQAAGFLGGTLPDAFHVVANIAATIGGILWDGSVGLAGAIVRATGGLQSVLPDALHVVANIAATIGGILWDGSVSFTGALLSKIGVGVQTLPDALHVVANVAATLGGILWDQTASLAGALVAKMGVGSTTLPDAIQVTTNVAATLGGILWDQTVSLAGAIQTKIGVGVHALPDAIQVSANIAATISDLVFTGYASVEDAVKAAMDWTGDKVISVGTMQINPTAIDLAPNIDFSGFFSAIGSAITTAASKAGEAGSSVATAVASIGTSIVDLMVRAVTFDPDSVQAEDIGNRLGKGLADLIKSAILAVVDFAKGDSLSNDVAEQVVGVMGDIGKGLVDLMIKGLQTAIDAPAIVNGAMVGSALLGVKILSLMVSGLAGFQQGFTENIIPDGWSDTANGLVSGLINGIISAISDFDSSTIGDLGGKLKDAVMGLIGKAISGIFSGGDGGVDVNKVSTFMNIGGGGKDTSGLGGGGFAEAILSAVGDSIVAALGSPGAALTAVTDKIKEAIKGLINDVIDSLPLPQIVKDALKNLGNLLDGVDAALSTQLKQNFQGRNQDGRGFRDFLNEGSTPGPTPGDVAGFLSRYALDDLSVNTIIQKAKDNATRLAAGIREAAATAARANDLQNAGANARQMDTGPARPKLPELGTQTAVKVPAADLTAYQASLAQIPVKLAVAFAAAIPVASAGATQIGVVIGTQIGLMVGNVSALMTGLTLAVGTGMTGALAVASIYATAIYTVVSTIIGTMVGNVAALMTGFTNAVGQGMSDALSVAAIYANEIYVQVSTSIGEMVGNVAALMSYLASVITSALQGAVSGAYSAGLAIGAGLASGITAGIPAVAAAAQAMANAASAATSAALKVASPSKVFHGIGEFVGKGFVNGMLSMVQAVRGAGTMLASAAIPSSTISAQTAAASARNGMASIGDTHNTRSEQRNYNIEMQTDLSKLSTIQDVVNVVNGLKRSIEIATAGGTVRTIA